MSELYLVSEVHLVSELHLQCLQPWLNGFSIFLPSNQYFYGYFSIWVAKFFF